jgi:exodeoxyribonuclease V beta subunit
VASWLRHRRDEDTASEDDEALRAQGGAQSVRVLTVHRSKGLEFGIVFLPYLWHGPSDSSDGTARFHDHDGRLVFDAGSPELPAHREQSDRELLDEQVRLCYVALTRAIHRCYLVFGPAKRAARSGIARLLFEGGQMPLAVDAHDALLTPWRRAAERPGASITIEALPGRAPYILPAAPMPEGLSAATLETRVGNDWRLVSFSSLRREAEEDSGSGADHDRRAAVASDDDAPTEVAGAVFGECVHAVIEQVDPLRWPDAGSRELLDAAAARFALGVGDREELQRLVALALEAPLAGSARLRDLAPHARVAELAFAYPLPPRCAPRLLRAFESHAATRHLAQTWAGDPARLQGLMRGFVDLCFEHDGRFHLLDWKTNRLGTASAYAQAGLEAAMRDHGYDLQAWIYALALHRLLRLRLGRQYAIQRHLGDAVYVFVRGLRHGGDAGIWRRRLDPDLILALDGALEPA